MSKKSDEIYDGLRCGVCEELFRPGDRVVFFPETLERMHEQCSGDDQ